MPTYTDAESVSSPVSTYATVDEANNFLRTRFRQTQWLNKLNDQEKLQCLVEATQLIDNLDFAGEKTDEDQELEFPRGGDTVYPTAVVRACILCAKEIASGLNVERMVDSVGKVREGTMGSADQYNRWYITDYVRAGIPSAEAWALLRPFLADPNEVLLTRTS